jgi:farnesyl-diphosphate farnesyltransferase
MKSKEILRRTSRSFYLTLRVLPSSVREEVCLAYLLARASDTLADTSSESPDRRLGILRSLRASLDEPLISSFDAVVWSEAQSQPAERELIKNLPVWWAQLSTMPSDLKPLLQRVLAHILEGQIFDLERFTEGAPPLNEQEVERYTYRVAGSVGEFWTDLCALRGGEFSDGDLEKVRPLARGYGQGLQLVNMLRDRAADRRAGRVYLAPGTEASFAAQARILLQGGLEYASAMRCGRLRYAVVLPAMIGLRTLDLLEAETKESPKISRREVRKILLRALPVYFSCRWVSAG